jgi:hypothetical protein
MRKVKATFDKRIRIEPEIQSKERYRVGTCIYSYGSLSDHENEQISEPWGSTRFYQTKSGKLKVKGK